MPLKKYSYSTEFTQVHTALELGVQNGVYEQILYAGWTSQGIQVRPKGMEDRVWHDSLIG